MFKVTIEGIADKALGDLVAHIGTKKYPVRVTYYPHPDQDESMLKTKANGKGGGDRSKDSDIMSLTGKSASKGSVRDAVLKNLERLEKKHGIGTVTRKMLREDCAQRGTDSQIIYQLVKGGFMRIAT